VKTMQRDAAAYQDYLQSLTRELPLTLHLRRIEWNRSWGGQTEYEVMLNARTVMQGKVEAVKNEISKNVEEQKVAYRLEDGIKLTVRAKHIGGVWNTDYGSKSWEGKVRDLDGASAALEHPVFFFALEGLPKEPELPLYRKE
jgi:hypothetical protein